MIVTPETFDEALTGLRTRDVLVFDFETTGLKPFSGDRILGLAVKGYQDERSFYFPFDGYQPKTLSGMLNQIDGELLPYSYMEGPLADLLAGKILVGHNVKFDMKFLYAASGRLPERCVDTRVAASLNDENESHALKVLGDKYVGAGSSDEQTELLDELRALRFKAKNEAMQHLGELPVELVGKYAIQDVVLTDRLASIFAVRLANRGLGKLWSEYNEFLMALTRMECRGIAVDTARVRDLLAQELREAAQKEAKVRVLADKPELNVGSPQQLGAVLRVDSTAADVLERMEKGKGLKSEIAGAVLEYRKVAKRISSFYEPYLELVSPAGDIHCDIYLGGARTGRLSCREPNLQQVPRDGHTVKSCFVARPGYVLVEADYEQQELRLATHLAREERMAEAFRTGQDPHQLTADALGIDRHKAKTINFLTLYGGGPAALASQLGIPEDVAADYLADFRGQFPAFTRAYRSAESHAKAWGYVKLWTGRIRRFPDEEFAHKAFNSLIQGGSAEITRRAITRLDQALERDYESDFCRMLLTVHDSIVFEVREGTLAVYGPTIRDMMLADNDQFSVPQDVELKAGRTWGDMKVLDLKGVTCIKESA